MTTTATAQIDVVFRNRDGFQIAARAVPCNPPAEVPDEAWTQLAAWLLVEHPHAVTGAFDRIANRALQRQQIRDRHRAATKAKEQ